MKSIIQFILKFIAGIFSPAAKIQKAAESRIMVPDPRTVFGEVHGGDEIRTPEEVAPVMPGFNAKQIERILGFVCGPMSQTGGGQAEIIKLAQDAIKDRVYRQKQAGLPRTVLIPRNYRSPRDPEFQSYEDFISMDPAKCARYNCWYDAKILWLIFMQDLYPDLFLDFKKDYDRVYGPTIIGMSHRSVSDHYLLMVQEGWIQSDKANDKPSNTFCWAVGVGREKAHVAPWMADGKYAYWEIKRTKSGPPRKAYANDGTPRWTASTDNAMFDLLYSIPREHRPPVVSVTDGYDSMSHRFNLILSQETGQYIDADQYYTNTWTGLDPQDKRMGRGNPRTCYYLYGYGWPVGLRV